MLPVGALLTSIFIGWKADDEPAAHHHRPVALGVRSVAFLAGVAVPLAVAIILVSGLFPSILGS